MRRGASGSLRRPQGDLGHVGDCHKAFQSTPLLAARMRAAMCVIHAELKGREAQLVKVKLRAPQERTSPPTRTSPTTVA